MPPIQTEQVVLLPPDFQYPVLPLWAWREVEWLPVPRLPAYAPRRSLVAAAVQPPLFVLDEVGA
jgi:hypothetical protein